MCNCNRNCNCVELIEIVMLIGFWKELVIVIIIDYWKAVIATTLLHNNQDDHSNQLQINLLGNWVIQCSIGGSSTLDREVCLDNTSCSAAVRWSTMATMGHSSRSHVIIHIICIPLNSYKKPYNYFCTLQSIGITDCQTPLS